MRKSVNLSSHVSSFKNEVIHYDIMTDYFGSLSYLEHCALMRLMKLVH